MNSNYNIGQRLKNVMAKRNITIAELALMSDLSEDTIKAIRSGKTKNPSINVIISIADALGCTLDGLIGRPSLSIEEVELLKDYRSINSHGRHLIQTLIECEHMLQTQFSYKKENGMTISSRTITCLTPLTTLKDGVNYDMNEITYLDIPEDCYRDADFCIKITSRNLHPIYVRDDILAVAKRFPRNDEIGVFVHKSGIEYVRKFNEKDNKFYLTSLNQCGKNFVCESKEDFDFTCLGTVLGIIRSEHIEKNEIL